MIATSCLIVMAVCGQMSVSDYARVEPMWGCAPEIDILDEQTVRFTNPRNRQETYTHSFEIKESEAKCGQPQPESMPDCPANIDIEYCDGKEKTDPHRAAHIAENVCTVTVHTSSKDVRIDRDPRASGMRVDVDNIGKRVLVRRYTQGPLDRQYYLIDMCSSQVIEGEVDKRVGRLGRIRTSLLQGSDDIMSTKMWLWVGRPYIIYTHIYLSGLKFSSALSILRPRSVFSYVLDVCSEDGSSIYTFREPIMTLTEKPEVFAKGKIVILAHEAYHIFRFNE